LTGPRRRRLDQLRQSDWAAHAASSPGDCFIDFGDLASAAKAVVKAAQVF
jgi:hypothetical protein